MRLGPVTPPSPDPALPTIPNFSKRYVNCDGTKANELRAVNVHEFSFVPVGANPTTFVESVKTARDIRQIRMADMELRLRLARVH